MVEQRPVTPISNNVETPKTGGEVLADIHSRIFGDLYSVNRRNGIHIPLGKSVIGLRNEFLSQVLSDERVTKEDLAQFLTKESEDASFGRTVRKHPNYVKGDDGWNPMACR